MAPYASLGVVLSRFGQTIGGEDGDELGPTENSKPFTLIIIPPFYV